MSHFASAAAFSIAFSSIAQTSDRPLSNNTVYGGFLPVGSDGFRQAYPLKGAGIFKSGSAELPVGTAVELWGVRV